MKSNIHKGTIVRYKDGHVKVTAVFPKSQTVNLGGVFNGKIYHKGVPMSEIQEDEKGFNDAWVKSETYMCM